MELSALNGSNGFEINGEAGGDQSGHSVSSAGDVNGDGYEDLVIGAPGSGVSGFQGGASYVVFGRASGFEANLQLSALDGSNGFQINGEAALVRSGSSVSSAGDVNGDGFDDLVIGAPGGSGNAAHVVFGKASGFAANLQLSALNGANGFKINGETVGDSLGVSVSAAGDVNGDGVDDLVIGASNRGVNGGGAGASYVVFGQASGFAASLHLSALNGTNGFEINGETGGDQFGCSVSAAGDVNGDGLGDLVIGAIGRDINGSFAGASYIVFGRASGFAANLALSTLDGSNGFEINGEAGGDELGHSVSSAGDVNGDGYDDLVIGAPNHYGYDYATGASYVVFGRASGFTASLALSTLDGSNGFEINGEAGNDYSGYSVSAAGDLNGDGLGDLVIGAYGRDIHGSLAGASYVVFGQASGFTASLDLAALNGTNGFEMNGESGGDRSGYSVSAAGDVNGDGFDDLVIGAYGRDVSGNNAMVGASYVVFGADFTGEVDSEGTAGNDSLTGDGDANVYVTGLGDDTLNGAGGNDVLKGGSGDDLLIGGAGDDRLFGGLGFDAVSYESEGAAVAVNLATGRASGASTGNDLLDEVEGVFGTGLADTLIGSSGEDLLSGGGGNDTLTGGASGDVFRIAVGDGTDFITDFSGTDAIDVEGIAITGIMEGNGSSVLAGQAQVSSSGGITTIHIGADSSPGAELSVTLQGSDLSLRIVGGDIAFNNAPSLTQGLADRTALADVEFEFALPEGAVVDADPGDELTYSATLQDDSPLPEWLTFNGETLTFSGTPGVSDAGTIEVELTATDSGGLSVSDVFTISVDAGAPVLVTGVLDPDFGTAGQVLTDFSGAFDSILDVTVQPGDGKIVAAGATGNDFAVARYNPDGSLDTSFSGDGKVATDFALGFESAVTLVLQSDGKIVVVGDSIASGFIAVARYNANGTLDTSFSDDGKVTTAGPAAMTSVGAVTVQSDGKILVAAMMDDMAVLRYTTSGILDDTFDGDGKALIDVGAGSGARAIAVQDDGKIVVAGTGTAGDDMFSSFALARFDSSGVLDEDFGTDGTVLTPAGSSGAQVTDMAIQADGKIVVLGYSHNGTDNDFTLARYDEQGVLDETFGAEGLATVDFGGNEQNGRLALQADGRIVITGGFNGFSIARFTAGGLLDSSFDGDGKWVVAVGEGGHNSSSVAVSPDGGLIVAGQATGASSDFALIRILPAGIPDQATPQDAALSLDVSSYFGDPNGDTLTFSATLEGEDPLPDWLFFDTATGAFSGTPDADDQGIYQVEVTASDGSESVSDVFVLTVTTNAEVIEGDEGADTLDGGAGADTMIGFQGDDTYIVDDPADVIVEQSGAVAGDDEARASVSYVLPANVEDLFLTGDAPINGTGNGQVNEITGNSGANRLDGGALDDVLTGLGGNDTYVVDNVNDQVNEASGEGEDTIESSVSYDISSTSSAASAHVEGMKLTGEGNINATGNALGNTLHGNSGNNTLNGGTGADTMLGGDGDDTYIVDNPDDVVIEEPDQGADVIRSSVTRTLEANVENLFLTGGSAISGTGNELVNQLIGNNGNNVLTGLGGNDLLKGADVLNGNTGADTLIGGLGNDLYYVDSASDVVVELAGAGQGTADTVYASINLTLAQNVERVIIVDTAAHFITGNGLSNVFQGNNGNDTLAGGGGNDTLTGGGGKDRLDGGTGQDSMKGGAGDDTYIVDNINDKVVETSNAPGGLLLPGADADPLAGVAGITDTVIAAVNYVLGNFLEHLLLSGAAARGTGNALANNLVGNAGADTLDGGAGNDTLDGGTGVGADRLIGGTGNDVLVWGAGDKLDGGAGTDTLKVKSGSLNLVPLGVTSIANIETVDLRGGGNNTLTLNAQDVLDFSPTDTLKVLGDAGDKVSAAGFIAGATSGGFRTYTNGLAKLLVETDVVVA